MTHQPTPVVPPAPRERRHVAYQPALDGVRALAIVTVLAFHLGAGWMTGGYLGVSVFFTLSGFLITSLLLEERRSTGRIGIGAFYVRRLRRLMPASLMCLAAISVLVTTGVILADPGTRSSLFGSLFQVANWEALLGDRSYAELVASPSPAIHFWSLAIEEQFYWLWPVAMAGLAVVASRRARPMRATAVALVGLFVLLSISAVVTAQVGGADAAYYASWARFAEIVAGAALAVFAVAGKLPRVPLLAPVCAALILALCVVTPDGRGWAYEGMLPLFALLTVGLIIGVQFDGPVTRALSVRPIVWIGRVSFGLYLIHWPVIIVFTPERTGLDGVALAALRLAVTFTLAALSFHFVEAPLRYRRALPRVTTFLPAMAASAAAVLVGLAMLPDPTADLGDDTSVVFGATDTAEPDLVAQVTGVAERVELASTGAVPLAAPLAPPAPPQVVVFGDSVPDWLLRRAATAGYQPDGVAIIDAANEGCDGAVDAPPMRDRDGDILELPDDCLEWVESYPTFVDNDRTPVDVALLMLGNAPMFDREIDGAWTHPCQDLSWYVDDVTKRVRYLEQHVGTVVLALPSWNTSQVQFAVAEDYLNRMGCIRYQLAAMAIDLDIPILDLANLLCPDGPDGSCPELRELDGVHVDPEDAADALDWVVAETLATSGEIPTEDAERVDMPLE